MNLLREARNTAVEALFITCNNNDFCPVGIRNSFRALGLGVKQNRNVL